MAANIKLKRSAVQSRVPTTSDLELGELGLNTYDGKVYMKKDDGTAAIVEVGSPIFVDDSSDDSVYPVTATRDVLIGGTLPSAPNITLNADGDIDIAAGSYFQSGALTSGANASPGVLLGTKTTGTYGGIAQLGLYSNYQSPNNDPNNYFITGYSSDGASTAKELRFLVKTNGDVRISDDPSGALSAPNISLNADGTAKYESDSDVTLDDTGVVELRSSDATPQAGSENSNLLRLVANTTNGYTASLISVGKYEDSSFGRGELTIKVPNISLSANLAEFKFRGDGKTLLPGNVLIGGTLPSSPNISLNADGSAEFAGKLVSASTVSGDAGTTLATKDYVDSSGGGAFEDDSSDDSVYPATSTRDVKIGGTLPSAPNITLNSDGTIVTTADATINTLTVGLGNSSVSTNTVFGLDALDTNTTGQQNTAVGNGALQLNTTGNFNTAVGRQVLDSNTEGAQNTAMGVGALQSNTSGDANTAVGYQTLYTHTTGDYNTAVGRYSLYFTTSGKGNIGIGGSTSTGTFSPVFNATTHSDRIVLGSTAVVAAYVKVAWSVTSDARDKTNFAPVPHGLDFVNQLQPTAYQFKAGARGCCDPETNEPIPATPEDELPSGPVRYGFLAQDILALEGDNPVIIDDDDPDHLKYKGEHLVPVLVNAVQELTTMVNDLQAEVQALKDAAS